MHITEPLPGNSKARLIFGLDWRAYPVKGARAERRRYADDFGATHYVEYKVGNEMIGGFAAPESADYPDSKLFSGAARIAQHARIKALPAALVLLQDDAQRVHAIFVVRGAVRTDEVLTPADVFDRRVAVEQECLKQNLPLVTLGTGANIGDVDESFTALALLADKKTGRVRKMPLAVPTLVPVTVIVVAVVLIMMEMLDAFSPPPPPPHQETRQEKYAKAVAQTFLLQAPLASRLAPLLLSQVGGNESVVEGWLVERVLCPATGYCANTYTRVGGTFAGFDAAAPASMRPIAFDADGKHLSTRGAAVPKVAAVRLDAAKLWPSEQALIDMLQTPAQKLSVKPFDLDSHGYEIRLQPAHPLATAPPGTPGAGRVPHMIREGTWQIDGYRWQAVLLSKLPPSMSLDSLAVELRTKGEVGIHFTAKGKYYVQD
ncbi:hypothetical protein [Paraburkholderia sediminicola]|uniref:hypothetical protein n=1 Tax=Paraburkholderia sediminicola TaxID=458836 RepID=UPI0038BE108A